MDYFEGQLTWLALKFFFYLLSGSSDGPSTLSLWLRKALFSVLLLLGEALFLVLLLLGKALFLVLRLFYYLLSGSSEGPSTILWLRKALFSVVKFLFYLSVGFPDGQPTLSICKKCAGVPRSPLTLNLLRLADYIHEPLARVVQHGITFLKLLPFLAFFGFSIVVNTYLAYIYCGVIWKELRHTLYIFPSHFFRIFSHLFVLQRFGTKNCKILIQHNIWVRSTRQM